MRNLFIIFFLACIMLACSEKKTDTSTPAAEAVALPFEVTYKGTAEIGSMKNVQTVMEWNKRLSELNTDVGEFLADTVTLHMADGTEINAARDSIVTLVKGYFGNMSSMKLIYTAAVPLDNPAMKHEWVFSWTDETYTYKDGKVEHQFLHEDYRLENGKIREAYQYARRGEPSK